MQQQQQASTEEALDKLHQRVKELHSHLRALDTTIAEVQHYLSDSPPSKPDQRAPLETGLRQGLSQRQQILLEMIFAEAEIEVCLWRQWLDGTVLPRCAGGDGHGQGRSTTTDEIWPMRNDSLIPSPNNGSLIPLPLNVPGKLLTGNAESMCMPVVRMAPRKETKIDPGLRRQRSLIGLVKRLTSKKGVRSPVIGAKPG